MSETGLETQSQKPSMSRRSFLRLFGLGVGAATAVYLGLDIIDTNEEKLSKLTLTNKINAGMFGPENIGAIYALEDLKKEITEKTEGLKGVSAAGLYLSNVEENAHLEAGKYTEKFIAASLVKIPLLYNVWQRGEADGTQYLTKDAADRILGKSESCRDFLMNLPYNKDLKEEELNSVIKEMLTVSGIPSEIDEEGNIKVDLNEYFGFLRKTDLPPVMKEAMRQTQEDDTSNYGISSVLRSNASEQKDIFFKIGLAQEGNEATNSYVFMIGDDIKAVGYARGENIEQVHEQMLFTGAAIANFSSR